MYIEHRVINGILHVRYFPNAPFEPMSAEGITAEYVAAQAHVTRLDGQRLAALKACKAAYAILSGENWDKMIWDELVVLLRVAVQKAEA